jgi:transcriptional regulator with XRE-family HTH domain
MGNNTPLSSISNEERLGQVIKKRRELARLSQEDLAERAALDRTYVSQLERGLKSPSVRVLLRVAEALGCTSWELLQDAYGDETRRR